MTNPSSGSDREAQTGKTAEGKSGVTVTLENVRGINHLKFEVPEPGLWLVTGINGCGKSSLFAALYQLNGIPNFSELYKTKQGTVDAGSFKEEKAQIKYNICESETTYHFCNKNWNCENGKSLNKGSQRDKVHKRIPYEKTVLIGADKKRIQPTEDEIRHENSIKPSSEKLKEFMKEILSDNKWERLCQINKQGSREARPVVRAYLISKYNNKPQYFSEKSFSLGELCLLRLGEEIMQSEQGSLILIEEIDMALHSKIQLKLYNKLKEIAEEKKHTILFSSHSSSLIKRAFREDRKDQKVIFLQRESELHNNIKVITEGLSPAKVLKDITDHNDEHLFDFIYLVEDKAGKYLLKSLIEGYNERSKNNTIDYFTILPFGGWPEIYTRYEDFKEVIQEHIRISILLDRDVEEKAKKNSNDKQKVDKLQARFLPITPEKGLVTFLTENNDAPVLQKNGLYDSKNIKSIIQSKEYGKIRCDKKRFDHIVRKIAGKDDKEDDVRLKLYRSYANYYADNSFDDLHKLLMPQKAGCKEDLHGDSYT